MHLPSKKISYTHLKKKIVLNENNFLYFHKRVKLFRTISILLTSILTLFVFFSAERFLNFLHAYSYFCCFYSSERLSYRSHAYWGFMFYFLFLPFLFHFFLFLCFYFFVFFLWFYALNLFRKNFLSFLIHRHFSEHG